MRTVSLCARLKQECIPVGCIPPAAVAISWGGSASVHAGIHQPPLPWVWAWRLPTGQTLQAPPWVWAWKPARHAGIPPWRSARHAGIPPHPCVQNSWHTLLKILPCPKLRLRAVKIFKIVVIYMYFNKAAYRPRPCPSATGLLAYLAFSIGQKA